MEDWIREYLGKCDIYESMGSGGLQRTVLKELLDTRVRLLMMLFERPWQSGEVPEDCKKANVTPVFSKYKKEDSGSYWLVAPTSFQSLAR